MSFAFNFSDDESDDTPIINYDTQTTIGGENKTSSDIVTDSGEFDPIKNQLYSKSDKIAKVTSYTDVIHGVYEGGLKIWECSDDLLSYLSKHYCGLPPSTTAVIPDTDESPSTSKERSSPQSLEPLCGRRVIDLGCGHGHPGIWCLTRGVAYVCMQDLNIDALSTVTVPNVLSICGSIPILKKKISIYDADENSGAARSQETPPQVDAPSEDVDKPSSSDQTSPHSQTDSGDYARLEQERKADLQRLETLVHANTRRQTKRTNLKFDQSTYERIKAMVLAGEEDDPDLIEFVLEVEAELAEEDNSDHENDATTTSTTGDEQQDEGKPATAKAKAADETAAVPTIPVHKISSSIRCTPHATFIYGPWGTTALEKYMLLSNNSTSLQTAPTSTETQEVVNAEDLPFQSFTYDELDILDVHNSNKDDQTGKSKSSLSVLSHVSTEVFAQILSQIQDIIKQLGTQGAEESDMTPIQAVLTVFIPPTTGDTDEEHTESTRHADVMATLTTILNESTDAHPNTDTTSLSATFNALSLHGDNNEKASCSQESITISLSITPTLITLTKIAVQSSHKKDVDDLQTISPHLGVTTMSIIRQIAIQINSYFSRVLASDELPGNTPSLKKSPQHYRQSAQIHGHRLITIISASGIDDDAVYHLLTFYGRFYETSWRYHPTPLSGDNHIAITLSTAVYSSSNASNKVSTSPDTPTPQTSPAILRSIAYHHPSLFYGSHPLQSPFRYDVILSSDTLYNSATMPILLSTIRSLLHRDGVALIAAKRYYFGIGGSTGEMMNHVAQCNDMSIELAALFQDGHSNIREILAVRWNKSAIQHLW